MSHLLTPSHIMVWTGYFLRRWWSLMTNAISWIFIMLAHWNNSLQVDKLFHLKTLTGLQAHRSLLLRCEFETQSGDTTLWDKVCQWLATGRFFSSGTLVSSTNKNDRHDITEILLKMALNTINHTPMFANLIKMNNLIKSAVIC